MLLDLGLQTNVAGSSAMAWMLDYPGCFAVGADGPHAVLAAPRAFIDYQAWVGKHIQPSWLADLGDFDVRLVETWENYTIDKNFELAAEGYTVDAWFRHDWKPLTAEDVRRASLLLEASRADLLGAFAGLTSEEMLAFHPGERWPIQGILGHVGGAEWWYLDNLGLSGGRQALPKDPFERLESVRARLLSVLPGLVGVQQVIGQDGELWSPRKLLRRALWHERDHTGHIFKLRYKV